MKKITIWERLEPQQNVWFHNHVEDGWIKSNMPIGTDKQNKYWKDGIWKKTHGYLKQGVIK